MPRIQRKKSQSGYYHVIIRGNERKNIFYDEDDKRRFLEIVKEKMQGNRFSVQVYCLMDNHVHMLIKEEKEDVSNAIKRINVSYVYYFNAKYKRIGHLFQDRFRSEAVEEDRYLLALARYIHQNPVKAGIVKSIEDYKWSSYQYYINQKLYFAGVLDTEAILGLFSEDKNKARILFIEFMNQEEKRSFIDITEEENIKDEKEAKELFIEMMKKQGQGWDNVEKTIYPSKEILMDYKIKTGLSIRKIAYITGLNKDKLSKILRR
ncbi:MAG: transposase [Eubacteriales bacterium]|jgi:REP element-mobilizing transposase RayT